MIQRLNFIQFDSNSSVNQSAFWFIRIICILQLNIVASFNQSQSASLFFPATLLSHFLQFAFSIMINQRICLMPFQFFFDFFSFLLLNIFFHSSIWVTAHGTYFSVILILVFFSHEDQSWNSNFNRGQWDILNKHKFNVISTSTKYVSGIKLFLNEWIENKRFTDSS